MSPEEAKQLLGKYLSGHCTAGEEIRLRSWYQQYERKELPELSGQESDEQLDRIWKNVLDRTAEPIATGKPVRLWPRIAAAASILLFLSIGGYYMFHKQPTQQTAQTQQHDLKPGGSRAILTLANGQKIILNTAKNGVIASQGNMSISNQTGQLVYNNTQVSAAGANLANVYDTLTTPRGGMYHLTLADGSTMWLNAATSVRYPAGFTGKYRDVELLYGEAYFEVRRNDKMPFRVLNDGQVTEDMGTHFNINAYKDEPSVNTTLLEGSIKVSKDAKAMILKPGQQAVITTGSSVILLKDADTEQVMAWKNGLFSYNSTPLETVMRQIARWYDADIVYQSPGLKLKTFSGSLSRYDNVSRMLKSIEFAGSVKFKIEDRKIIVMQQ